MTLWKYLALKSLKWGRSIIKSVDERCELQLVETFWLMETFL